jgi:serine protease Do
MYMNRCALVVLMMWSVGNSTSLAGVADGINLRRTVTVEVVEKTKDAVVNISASKLITKRVSPFGNDPFWQLGGGQTVQVPGTSLGSGFLIHRDGYVVTNNHVIDRARQITVELSDGRKLPAELISSDADADLAVLKISSDHPFPVLSLGDSSDLMIGEPVIAVGNPLGYSHTVSTGIVSALHRNLKDNSEPLALRDLVQTDAAINPGNSGGPLLNAYGEVIGINTAVRSDAQNIGFSIPINRLRDLIPELMNPASASKVDIPIHLKEKRELTPPATIVSHVLIDEPKPRTVQSIDGKPINDIVDAYAVLLRSRQDHPIEIVCLDGEKALTLTPHAVATPDAIVAANKLLGLTVAAATPAMAEKFHLSVEDGIFVSGVMRDSIAARAGIEAGDVIVQLGRYRIRSLDDFGALLHRLPKSGQVRAGVVRGEQIGFGTLSFDDGSAAK